MIRMGVVEANNILATLAAFALDAYQLARINVVAVLWRIGAGVAAARRRGHDADAAVIHVAEQHTATLVRISFFAVAAEGFVVVACDFQHGWTAEVRSKK